MGTKAGNRACVRVRTGGAFVEERGAGNVERGQIGDHRLEVEQTLQATLWDDDDRDQSNIAKEEG